MTDRISSPPRTGPLPLNTARPASTRTAQTEASTPVQAPVRPQALYTGTRPEQHPAQANRLSFPDKPVGKPPAEPENPAGARINAAYDESVVRPATEQLPRLQNLTPDQRLSALNNVTQLDDNSQTRADEVRCGAASLTGAALYAGGEQGLVAMMDAAERFNRTPPNNERNQPVPRLNVDLRDFAAIRQRIASGQPLSQGDVARAQEGLFNVLHTYQERSGRGGNDGLTGRTINAFMDFPATAAYRSLLDNHNVGIRHIANDGGSEANHFVMMVPAQSPTAVYDPYPRRGGQVIRDPGQVRDYLATVSPRSGQTYNPPTPVR